jgi:hypothetical protein
MDKNAKFGIAKPFHFVGDWLGESLDCQQTKNYEFPAMPDVLHFCNNYVQTVNILKINFLIKYPLEFSWNSLGILLEF